MPCHVFDHCHGSHFAEFKPISVIITNNTDVLNKEALLKTTAVAYLHLYLDTSSFLLSIHRH